MRTIAIALVALFACGCGKDILREPLIPADAAWNAQKRQTWAPCPSVWPYFHGYDEAGEPRCTVRPGDMTYHDVDSLEVP